MRKDDALQKAKLYFVRQGGKEKLLPYFWANMVLMGNAEPVSFSHSTGVPWWLIIFVPALLGACYIIILKRKKLRKKISEPSPAGKRQASLSCSDLWRKINNLYIEQYDFGMLPGLSSFFDRIKKGTSSSCT
jgi:hypothetical protein